MCMYIRKENTVYIGFGIYWGSWKVSPTGKGELLYIFCLILVFLGMQSGFVGLLNLNWINLALGTTGTGKYGQGPLLWGEMGKSGKPG